MKRLLCSFRVENVYPLVFSEMPQIFRPEMQSGGDLLNGRPNYEDTNSVGISKKGELVRRPVERPVELRHLQVL